MNQKVIVGIVVALVIIGGIFLLSKKTNAPAPATSETSEREMGMERRGAHESLMGRGSMSELLAKGMPLNCSFVHNNAEMGTGNGMGYFDGKRMRVDSMLTKDGKSFETHMIHDGQKLYTWTKSSEGNFAFMMPTQTSESDASSAQQDRARETLEETVEYSCDPWNPDENKFVPPSDIQFSDMSKMMEGMGGMGSHMMEDGSMMGNSDETGTMPSMQGMDAEDMEAMQEMMEQMPRQ